MIEVPKPPTHKEIQHLTHEEEVQHWEDTQYRLEEEAINNGSLGFDNFGEEK